MKNQGRRIFLKGSTNLIWFASLCLFSCGNDRSDNLDRGDKIMKLESTAFSNNGLIPKQYTCDGEDISPPLSWGEPPAETKSFVLICDDPDAPFGTFVHWVLYNLPPETRQLSENRPRNAEFSNGAVHGKTDFGKLGYGGPCPPSGTHRYFFKLYALDRQLNLGSGATKKQVEAAMKGHVLASAELMGRYTRQSKK